MKTSKLKIGMIAALIILTAGLTTMKISSASSTEEDMEIAKGSSPSTSYQYHLQIFHAF